MHPYILKAPAKINLYLEIVGDRPDGYHEVVMVLQSIDLADEVELHPLSGKTIRLHCDQPHLPQDQTNLAWKAAALMQQHYPDHGGVEIALRKSIPIGAGLAGGSTNAAAVLVGLNLMWDLGLTQAELRDLASQLGSDVPFCITGGTALAVGRGEILSPLPDLDGLPVVLGKFRQLSVSTAWAYQTFRTHFSHSEAELQALRGQASQMLSAIAARDFQRIGRFLYNDLEQVVLPAHETVARLRSQFQAQAVIGTMMSGSGPTVFALCQDLAQAQQVEATTRQAFAQSDLETWVTQLCVGGIQVVG